MKELQLISISLLFSISIIAQTSIVGKKFEAEVENICAKRKGGGCTTITNCILAFEKDSVKVTFPYVGSAEKVFQKLRSLNLSDFRNLKIDNQ